MLTKEIKLRVRYKETDAMGIVHHSNYVTYYETARTEVLREMGTTYRHLEETGIMLPVLEVTMKYYTPARYDDLLTIKITLAELPAVRMIFDHEVRNEQEELINTGRVVLAYMNAETRRACRAPKWFLELFEPYFR